MRPKTEVHCSNDPAQFPNTLPNGPTLKVRQIHIADKQYLCNAEVTSHTRSGPYTRLVTEEVPNKLCIQAIRLLAWTASCFYQKNPNNDDMTKVMYIYIRLFLHSPNENLSDTQN